MKLKSTFKLLTLTENFIFRFKKNISIVLQKEMVFVKSFLSAWIRILKVNDDKILPFWDPRLAGRLHHHGTRPVLLRGTGVLAPHLGG